MGPTPLLRLKPCSATQLLWGRKLQQGTGEEQHFCVYLDIFAQCSTDLCSFDVFLIPLM